MHLIKSTMIAKKTKASNGQHAITVTISDFRIRYAGRSEL